jgi:hypothetical protein
MPIVVDELITTLEVQDERRVREIVREELERRLRQRPARPEAGSGPDPTDPRAGDRGGER